MKLIACYFPTPNIQQQQQQSTLIYQHPQKSSFQHSPQPQTFNENSLNLLNSSINQQQMSEQQQQQFNFQHQNSQQFQQQHFQHNHWQQQQTYWQIPPMRKESMPALHL
uniref:Uncharacterized protein n=1 Tax=Meloidogyne floridensis TaxID=298350 RepID=A0A915NGH5_9BILA